LVSEDLKVIFGIWFYNGVFLKDEKGTSQCEGVTKALRQWRFNAIEVTKKVFVTYIQGAIANERIRQSIKPTTRKRLLVRISTGIRPQMLLWRGFKKFSVAKQRGFMNTLKKQRELIARIEKIKPIIF
jgi:hypothetical protein